jgi:tetratricopeptide (TPR) repeat protein
MGQIAGVLEARGQLDEALRIRREDELPVFERLGDRHSRAVTMGKIADVLRARGELDEALRIRREDELPIYEELGDQRARAVTMGKIADALYARGQVDEALRIRREQVLPIFEQLGLIGNRVNCQWWMAHMLARRDAPGDLDEARGLLASALRDAEGLGLPVAGNLTRALHELG